MKSKLVLCTMVLGCSMGLMAQQSSAPSSTPPTFPQDQSQQQPSSQAGQSSSPTAAPDAQDQAGQMDHSKMSDKMSDKQQKVEGCLSGTDGNFTLTDKSGMTYSLQGSNSDLAKHVGQEVRVEGMASAASSGSSAASSSSDASSASPSSSAAGSGNTLTVSKVKKISDSCPAAGAASSNPKQ